MPHSIFFIDNLLCIVKPLDKTNLSIKQECLDNTLPYPPLTKDENDHSRQIRYYHDRVDFHGEILMKPPAATSEYFACPNRMNR